MSTQDRVLTLAEVEKSHILHVLQLKNGNRTHTAKALDIGIRTLQRKLISWGMSDYLLNPEIVQPIEVNEAEIALLKNTLDATNGNRTKAALQLGVPFHRLYARVLKAGLYDYKRMTAGGKAHVVSTQRQ